MDVLPSTAPSTSGSTTDEVKVVSSSSSGEFDPYLVQFDKNDPLNPKNWSNKKKWYLTLASGLLVLNATFTSSSPSGIFPHLVREFHMSEKVGILTLSLFVTGYCVGPILWGPLSEQYGRRPVFTYPFFVYTCFQVGGALAPNTASMLIFRFLGGMFAAAPLTNTGALMADIWDAKTRGKALAIFTVAPFAGPALGPTVAGFIGDNTSWRWLFWVLAIFTGLCWVLIMLTIPESYAPVILVTKAEKKRAETGDPRYYAAFEKQQWGLKRRVHHVLVRPWVIFFTEPMVMALTFYMSFVYGCLYLLFEAYPIVFGKSRGFSAGVSGLMFLPLPIGGAIAVVLYVLYYNPKYELEVERLAPKSVPPEFRLDVTFYACPLFAASFFWFGWTSYPSISYWAPLMSGLLMGYSIQMIFLGLFNYMVDAYIPVAASVLAAMTVVRSIFGASFPLFGGDMYEALDPRWASTVVGCVAIALVPIPFLFKRYGPYLRRRSKYCPADEEHDTIDTRSPSKEIT
ncbi:MFS general substrate transporter [Coprinopsis marcescibilis]|uniref:MFS general substrate transporter n=1 Tax=Coprinopsis marcescibilis TaxID=230819 RepID=A0A5C3LPW8_COPMA|nr:MFS general substrate transporter [Coprinopsis marcescibilis]